MAIDSGRFDSVSDDGIPVFLDAGVDGAGEFACADCGYGIAVRRELPTCPMCGGETWEDVASSPFALTVQDPART